MITEDKVTEIFCITDEFSKKFDEEIANKPLLSSNGKSRRRRSASMSDSEIMTILIMFHFGTFSNFKHYYLHFIRIHLKRDFPDAVSYNRFVELESRVFFKMMFFLNLHSFGRCTLGRNYLKNMVQLPRLLKHQLMKSIHWGLIDLPPS